MKVSVSFLSQLSPILVVDCDNTVAYYPSEEDFAQGKHRKEDLVELPRSKGTGIVGFVSKETNALLEQLRAQGVVLVCASGMREATMRSRQPCLPAVQYWICETGGKIFELQSDGELREFTAWKEHLQRESDAVGAFEALHALKEELLAQGKVRVDSAGYETMLRISAKSEEDVREIVQRLPANLKHTFNLGFLDIQLPCCGKYSSAQWLVHYLNEKRFSSQQGGEGDAELCRKDHNYVYMGDDDNDIEISQHARLALIANPASANMQRWVSATVAAEALSPAELAAAEEKDNDQYQFVDLGDDLDALVHSHALRGDRMLWASKREFFRSPEGLLFAANRLFEFKNKFVGRN